MLKSKTIQVIIDEDIWKRYSESILESAEGFTVQEDVKGWIISFLVRSISEHEHINGFDVHDSQVDIKFL